MRSSSGLLLVPAMIGHWTEVGESRRALEFALSVLSGVFFLSLASLVLRYVFAGRAHIGDRVCGAISVYLLMGLAFAQIYQVVYASDPESFVFARPIEDGALIAARFLYLSFVTQTTIGYGDITPNTMATESLTIFQATTGVLYLTVLVAWLVGSIRPAARED